LICGRANSAAKTLSIVLQGLKEFKTLIYIRRDTQITIDFPPNIEQDLLHQTEQFNVPLMLAHSVLTTASHYQDTCVSE